MLTYLANKKILVTGGAGFIGSHLIEELLAQGCKPENITIADNFSRGKYENIKHLNKSIEPFNILSQFERDRMMRDKDVIFHLAAKVAGVGYNKDHQATMLVENVTSIFDILQSAVIHKVKKVILMSSACIYDPAIETNEILGFWGLPEKSNFGYGWAKRIGEIAAGCFRSEYKLNITIVRPFNTYGPRDHFASDMSHVIPSLIKKVFNDKAIKVWGDGNQIRSFIYVKDLARGLVMAGESDKSGPINLGSNELITIKQLINLIMSISQIKKKVIFDTSKPAGQAKRTCQTEKAKRELGFTAKTSMLKGLNETIEWYKLHCR